MEKLSFHISYIVLLSWFFPLFNCQKIKSPYPFKKTSTAFTSVSNHLLPFVHICFNSFTSSHFIFSFCFYKFVDHHFLLFTKHSSHRIKNKKLISIMAFSSPSNTPSVSNESPQNPQEILIHIEETIEQPPNIPL